MELSKTRFAEADSGTPQGIFALTYLAANGALLGIL